MAIVRMTFELEPRLPDGTAAYVADLLGRHPCEVLLARPRRSKLGDHRPPGRGRPAHRISVNEDLNPYAFLTTLLHELAHAVTWERHRHARRRPRPHGPEWRGEFEAVLAPVVASGALPDDVAAALANRRPMAATCSDRGLALALARYDRFDPTRVLVETLPDGTLFRVDGGLVFRAGRRLRSRRQCYERRTGREYRVHGLARVEPLSAEVASGSGPGTGTGHSAAASRPRGRRCL
jgi:hypothetical protein